MNTRILQTTAIAGVLVSCVRIASLSRAADLSDPGRTTDGAFLPAAGTKDRAAPVPSSTNAAFGKWGFDLSGIDRTVKPGDDFFSFANGGWVARTHIPPDKPSYGTLDALQDRAREQVRSVIRDSEGAHAPADTNPGRIGGLYHAFMDEARIERLGARPVQAQLARIRAVSTRAQMARLMGASHGGPGASFFRLSVTLDDKDPAHYALTARQAGLSLPRDYYIRSSFAAKKLGYRAYVARMLGMAGWPGADKQAGDIVAMETGIAEASWSITESEQLEKAYNPATPSGLQARAPGFGWKAWLAGAGAGGVDRIIVRQDTAFPRIARVFAATSLETVKAWEAFRVIDKTAPYLSKRFVAAHFKFHGKELQGQLEDRPRWQRGVDLVSGSLGEVVGKEYVSRYFPASSKATMKGLVSQLKLAFERRIESCDWMTPQTKRKALDKLARFGLKLGYPDKWRDYSGLKIDAHDLVGDVNRSVAFEWAYERGKLGKAVDGQEWNTTPQTVNAFYDEKRNEVVFPAAILQPPFFDSKADMAVNFGAIGGVIGHEMTHGFDSQGRKTDAAGKLTDWWRPEDAARFDAEAAKLGSQYDTYFVAPGAHVNGAQTMSENIADLGGVLLAIDAYRASLGQQASPVLDGFTGNQRVFLGWAQILRSKIRPEALIHQVTADQHPPDEFRVVGPLRNVGAWYEAWGVEPGDKFYLAPKDRVRIW